MFTAALVVSSSRVTRAALAQAIAPAVDDVTEAGAALPALRRPDGRMRRILVMDNRDGDVDKVVRSCKSIDPSVRALIVADGAVPNACLTAFAAGADGYVTADQRPEVLAAAVRTVLETGCFLDPSAVLSLVAIATKGCRIPGPCGLTSRELLALRLTGQLDSPAAAAKAMDVSPHTIKGLLRSAYPKLGANDRNSAVTVARTRGWM